MASNKQPSAAAVGWIFFASTMMALTGIFHVFTGIGGIAKDDIYERAAEYVFEFDVSTWGWIHLVVGLVMLFAAFGLYSGAVWARAVGVSMALTSAVTGFVWMPYFPVQGFIYVAVSVAVIWALTAHGRDLADSR